MTGWTAWARRMVFAAASDEAEVADFALLDQVLHRSRDVFNRYVGVDTMLIEKIDGVDAEPSERTLDAFFDVVRATVDTGIRPAMRSTGKAEFCGDDDLVAHRSKPFAYHLFIANGP